MANNNVNQNIIIKDSTIDVHSDLKFEDLWNSTLSINASLLKADQNTTLAQLDYKKINSRKKSLQQTPEEDTSKQDGAH